MKKDTRPSDLYHEIKVLCEMLRQPGTGQISDAADVHVSPDGTQAVFAGAIMDKLEGTPPTRIAVADLVNNDAFACAVMYESYSNRERTCS